MGLFDHFPYTNVHELNLDWILTMMKALEAEWDAFTTGNSLTFADPLQHDISKTYAKNTIVLDGNGNSYVSLQAVPVGVGLQNGDYWLMVFDYEAFIEKVNKNFTARYYRGNYRATAAMAIGDWLTVDDVLCKATAAIAADDVLEVGVNIEHFTLEDFIKAFMQSANQLIQQYKNDIDASEAAFTADLQAQFDAAIGAITVDSEVVLARTAWDGQVYPTLADAIQSQFIQSNAYMDNDILNYIENIEEVGTATDFAQQFLEGKGLSSAGNLFNDANRITTIDYANIKPVKYIKYHVENGYRIYIVTYTAKNDIASHNSGGWLTGDGYMQNQNDSYMRVCLATIGDVTPVTSADIGNFSIQYITDYDVAKMYSSLYRGYSLTPIDFNTYTQIGVYNLSNGVAHTNGPTATGGGTLIVLPTFGMLSTNLYTAAYPAPYLAQVLINAADKFIYIRYRSSGGTWRDWVSINDMTFNGAIAANTDLDSIYDLGNYSIENNLTLLNAPEGFTGGSLHVYYSYEHNSPNIQHTQMLISPYNKNIWLRYSNTAGVWRDWISVGKAPNIGSTTKWLAVGDSITYGVYSYLDENNNPASGITTSQSWVALLSTGLGYSVDIMASRGMGYTVTGADPLDPNAPRIDIDELMNRIEALPDDYNLITLSFGINDYNTSTSTIAAIETSFNDTIQRLVTKFPHARVIVMTPYNECRHGDNTTTYAYNYSYGSRTLKAIADVIKARCDYYGVEYLDVSNNFVFNNFNIVDLQPDQVHPSLTGHDLIAKTLAHHLLT